MSNWKKAAYTVALLAALHGPGSAAVSDKYKVCGFTTPGNEELTGSADVKRLTLQMHTKSGVRCDATYTEKLEASWRGILSCTDGRQGTFTYFVEAQHGVNFIWYGKLGNEVFQLRTGWCVKTGPKDHLKP
jgi:hypothetical protein